MEPINQSGYTLIRRSAAVPVQRTRIAEPERPPVKTPPAVKIRKAGAKLSGEGRLLLVQTLAGAFLLALAAAGMALGGSNFRLFYEKWTQKNAVDLPSLIEPIQPDETPLPESNADGVTALV